MKTMFTVCVYGNFKKKDIRLKIFKADGGTKQFSFQNILLEAGYDAVLFSVNDEDAPFLVERV